MPPMSRLRFKKLSVLSQEIVCRVKGACNRHHRHELKRGASKTGCMLEEILMKMLIASVVLATAMATPAFAQTSNRQARQPAADQAFAQAFQGPAVRAQARQVRRSANPSNDVFEHATGAYIGSDPDPFIRSMMAIDPPLADDNGD
jgi:hypothetical protein